jgi:hypothetical protein
MNQLNALSNSVQYYATKDSFSSKSAFAPNVRKAPAERTRPSDKFPNLHANHKNTTENKAIRQTSTLAGFIP